MSHALCNKLIQWTDVTEFPSKFQCNLNLLLFTVIIIILSPKIGQQTAVELISKTGFVDMNSATCNSAKLKDAVRVINLRISSCEAISYLANALRKK